MQIKQLRIIYFHYHMHLYQPCCLRDTVQFIWKGQDKSESFCSNKLNQATDHNFSPNAFRWKYFFLLILHRIWGSLWKYTCIIKTLISLISGQNNLYAKWKGQLSNSDSPPPLPHKSFSKSDFWPGQTKAVLRKNSKQGLVLG